jgi:hypothetical protein
MYSLLINLPVKLKIVSLRAHAEEHERPPSPHLSLLLLDAM